ncbi:nuclear transport factor 2 family protein [Streptomyces sp. NPDC059762]|uniref:nuclear transport factor 2 family protein n=1 Tax=Streptomyces sp. NPDC059762 TaxID=3346938 RepID=UPI0036537874
MGPPPPRGRGPPGPPAALLLGLLAPACSSPDRPTAAADTPAPVTVTTPAPSGASTAAGPRTAVDPALLAVARRYTEAANRGDVDGITAAYAPEARFDRAGTLFHGRDEIVGDFIRPDVVDDDGHYREISTHAADGRTVVEYIFTTGSGITEHFTYAYLVEDGVIVDVIGRYV